MTKTQLLLFPLLLVCAEMTLYLSNDMYLPALPALMREFQVSAEQVQLSLSSWFLGSMSMQLFIGPLSDRVGRRPILISGMLLFVGSTLLCALTSQLQTLVIARFIQGSSICFIIVAGYASIHELFNQRNAIHLLARMNSITVLAPALGPLLGSLILINASWRWTLWPLFIWGLIILILLAKWMPEPLPPDQRHPLKLTLLFKQYLSLIKNRRFIALLMANQLIFCGFIAWLVAGPFLIINQFHYPPLVFGLSQILIFSFFILASRLVKIQIEKIGPQSLIKRGLTLAWIGSSFATLAGLLFPSALSGLVLGMIIFAFGFGSCSACLQRLAIEASTEPMGSRMAILSTGLGSFGLLATLLVQFSYNGRLTALAFILLGTASLAILAYLLAEPGAYRAPTANPI